MYKNYKKVNKRLYQNLLRFFFALIYLRIEEDFELKNSSTFKNRWPTSDVSDIHSTPSNRYGYDRGSNRDRKSCLLRADSRGEFIAITKWRDARRRNARERERMIYRAARSDSKRRCQGHVHFMRRYIWSNDEAWRTFGEHLN